MDSSHEHVSIPAEQIVETVREPLLILSANLRVLRANRAFYQAFGVTPEQTEGQLLYALGNGHWDIPALRGLLEGVLSRQESFDDFEVIHDFPELGTKAMKLNARRIAAANGQPGAILLAIEDITDRKRVHDALGISEHRFRALATASGAVLYRMSPDWSELQALDGKGLVSSNESPISDWMERNIPESEHAAIREQMARCIATKSRFEMEHRVYRPDGSIGWTHSCAMPTLDEKGEIVEWVGMAEDVTARLAAEAALRASEARYAASVSAALDCIVSMDHEGKVTEWNPAAERTFGYGRDETLGRELASLIIPAALRERHRVGLARYLATGEGPVVGRRFEMTAVRKDGTEFPVELAVTRVPSQGQPAFTGYLRDITEAKRAERELAEAQRELEARVEQRTAELAEANATLRLEREFLSAVLEHAIDGIVACDADATLRLFNRATREFHGLPEQPLPPDQWAEHYDIYMADGKTRMPKEQVPLFRALSEGVVRNVEMVIAPRGQAPRLLTASGRAITGPDGAKLGAVVVMHDLTARRQAEAQRERAIREEAARREAEASAERLRQSEERLRAVFEQTEAGIAQVDLAGRFVLVNERYTQIVGRSREELQHLRMQDITHPDDLPGNLELFKRAVENGKPFVIEKRYIRPDGSVVWVNNSVSLIRSADGKANGVVAATVDITDRRRAEEAIRESEQHARRIIDNTVAFVGVMTPDGILTEANETALRAGGIPREAVVGQKFWDCYWWSYDPEVQAQVQAAVQRAAGGETVRYDVTVRMSGDTRMPIDFMLSPVRDDAGRITHLIPSATDITERKRVEEALRDSEARLRLALSIAKMGTFQIDLLTDAVTVNEAGRDIYGWAPGMPLTFSTIQSFFHPDDRDDAMAQITKAFDPNGPGEFEVEQRIIRVDGAVRWIRVRGRTLFEEVGGERRAVRCVGTYLDTSDQKEAERRREELLDRERTARAEAERTSRMKDEFLATLSHELRTPLNAILGWSQILASGAASAEDIAEGVRTIERNARAQTQIIEDLLDMSRIISGKVRLDVQQVDLATVVKESVETVRPSADAKGIRLQTVLDPRAGPISGDPARLQQVMWNLLTNAVKFTPKGGRVQVLLERVNSHLEISVIDTGEGIPPQFLPYVFDRFRQADATTTRRHGGLGLGLSIVKQLVELHGGSVSVKSAGIGEGTTFTLVLPLTPIHPERETGAPRQHPQSPSSSVRGGVLDDCTKIEGVKVLVVDDEPDARALIKRLLEDCDAEVITAGSADEAFALLKSQRPDVLASDVGMPGEDGYSLIRRIRSLHPEEGGRTPAVALTAYARAEDRVKAMVAGFQTHLAKPVDRTELIITIAGLAGRLGSNASS